MGVKRCAYGECRSDSRYQHKDYMKDVLFIRFPKPKTQNEKCDKWIKACSRADDFGRHRITQDTYVCSLHFVGGNGPSDSHPDPVPAAARSVEKKARPPPKDWSVIENAKKRRKILEPLYGSSGLPLVPGHVAYSLGKGNENIFAIIRR